MARRLAWMAIASATLIGVSIARVPDVWAQRITNPSPSQGATQVEPQTAISATFQDRDGVRVKPETVKVIVDDRDVTAQSVVTADFFSYRPATNLRVGEHSVVLEFANTAGRNRRVRWNFTVGQSAIATISSVSHNGENEPIGAGETLLVTVNGTPGSSVKVYLVRDGQQVDALSSREVSSGVYVTSAQVESSDSTREGIVLARLEKQGQVSFATAERPLQLVTGASGNSEQLTVQDSDTPDASTEDLPGAANGRLQPTVTNYQDGDSLSESSFTLEGTTLPNASVKVEATSETSLAGILGAQQTLADTTVRADADGKFSVRLNAPLISASGSVYTIRLTGMQGDRTSPTTTLKLTQE